MVAGGQLAAKLLRRIQHGIHLAPKPVFQFAQYRDQVDLTHRSDDHQIHVARGAFFLARNRTIDQPKFDAAPKCFQGLDERRHDPGSLFHQSAQIPKNGGTGISPEIDAAAILAPLQDSRADERYKLPLEAGWSRTQVPSQLAEIPPALRFEQGGAENSGPGRRENGIEWGEVVHGIHSIRKLRKFLRNLRK